MLSPRITWLGLILVFMLSRNALAQSKASAMAQHTSYRTVKVDGLAIFYREAGPKNAPRCSCCTAFPLHRGCSRRSSPAFRSLSPGRARLPGLRTQRLAGPEEIRLYIRSHAEIINHFTEAIGLVALHAVHARLWRPCGFSHGTAHPERVEALIVQDAVAHNEGLGANWATRRAFWADRHAHEQALRNNLLSLATTKTRHIGDDPKIERYDPDLWTDEYAFLNAPGRRRFKAISSMTTARTSPLIRSGRHG